MQTSGASAPLKLDGKFPVRYTNANTNEQGFSRGKSVWLTRNALLSFAVAACGKRVAGQQRARANSMAVERHSMLEIVAPHAWGTRTTCTFLEFRMCPFKIETRPNTREQIHCTLTHQETHTTVPAASFARYTQRRSPLARSRRRRRRQHSAAMQTRPDAHTCRQLQRTGACTSSRPPCPCPPS